MEALRMLLVLLIVAPALLKLLSEALNRARILPELPGEFAGVYDEERYRQSQHYLRHQSGLSILREGVDLALTLGLVLLGGFAYMDEVARGLVSGSVAITLCFFLMLILLHTLIGLPFSWYSTFVLEEKYGFNRSTVKTFVADQIKGILIGLVLGLSLLFLVMWLFQHLGAWGWLWAWLAVAGALLLLQVLAPALILPLFFKFKALEQGELRERIEAYAARVEFKLRGVFTVDGSRRSSRGNAFFTGLGRWKRIALFDTLIDKHSVDELECVLAHEMGHFKLRHILKSTLFSVLNLGLLLFLFSQVIHWEELALAAGFQQVSFHAGLVAFGFLAIPLSLATRLLGNWISRRHEYEADAYSGATTQRPADMISALKRLAVDNMSNLRPHPLKVALEDSHPPILERIRALR